MNEADTPTTMPTTPAGTKPGKGRTVIVVTAIVVFLGVVLFMVRNNVDADDLAVGDCFTIPDGATVQTVERHPCTESHNAEVIFVGEYTGSSFPISLSLDSYVEEQCLPAFETYIGRPYDSDPELAIAYFHPTRDGWDGGDKTITCYIAHPDRAPMTESLRAA